MTRAKKTLLHSVALIALMTAPAHAQYMDLEKSGDSVRSEDVIEKQAPAKTVEEQTSIAEEGEAAPAAETPIAEQIEPAPKTQDAQEAPFARQEPVEESSSEDTNTSSTTESSDTSSTASSEDTPTTSGEEVTTISEAAEKQPLTVESEVLEEKPAAPVIVRDTGMFKDALTATYASNPRIKAERNKLQGIDENVNQALSGFKPSAALTYDKGRKRTDFAGAGWQHADVNDTALRVEQPLFRGFGTISSFRAAKQRAKAGQADLMAVEQSVMLQAITAYMDVVANQSILELSRSNKDVLQKQLQASNDRFEVGEVTRTDVAQSEARLSQARTSVIESEGQLITSIAAFQRTVGFKPEGALGVPDHSPELPGSLQEALTIARNTNPQLLSALRAYKASDYDINTNISSILPRVSLVGTMSDQEGAGALGNSTFEQDSLVVNFQVPLYQSGAEYSRVREAKAIARQQKHNAMEAELGVEENVTRAWEDLETSIATITERNDQIKAAEIALDGVRQEQEYGARTVLDVLDAEQELFSARTNLVRAQRDRMVATYSLLLTLGQLTPEALELNVASYDPTEHYDDVKWQMIGF